MYSNLIHLINQITTLGNNEIELIKSSFKPLNINKGDYFLEAGKINRHVGFINKGLVRYFVYKDGEESTFEFTKEGEFIADYQSFNNKCISVQNIQAIEPCEILIINFDNVQTIFNTTKNGNLIGRLIVEHRFDVMVNQLLAVYMQNHEQRYQSFISNYSDLSQRIPQYLIASYVGVKPQSLSRIRRRFAKNIS
ncbi:Crp/Fnr family transcriptional regulator [Robiginitalea sp. IMCC43444]|uniref:Crp/Fnr family transcriptional regulator n=1 Tax=Robiginitalea sp. IMCC43444 TaxID=3459121 RepID=UPI004043265E